MYTDDVHRLVDGTTLREVTSSYIEIFKPLMGKVVFPHSIVKDILDVMPSVLEDKPESFVVVSKRQDGPPLKVRYSSDSHLYNVAFSCADQWWFSENALKSVLEKLNNILSKY